MDHVVGTPPQRTSVAKMKVADLIQKIKKECSGSHRDPGVCPICNKLFTKRSNLFTHGRKLHKINFTHLLKGKYSQYTYLGEVIGEMSGVDAGTGEGMENEEEEEGVEGEEGEDGMEVEEEEELEELHEQEIDFNSDIKLELVEVPGQAPHLVTLQDASGNLVQIDANQSEEYGVQHEENYSMSELVEESKTLGEENVISEDYSNIEMIEVKAEDFEGMVDVAPLVVEDKDGTVMHLYNMGEEAEGE